MLSVDIFAQVVLAQVVLLMAVTFTRLRARIGLANVKVGEAKEVDQITWKAVSLTQGRAVADLYPQCTLDSEQRSTLLGSVSKISWHEYP